MADVVSYVSQKNMIVTPEAAFLLETIPNFKEIIDKIHDQGHFVVTEDLIKSFIEKEEVVEEKFEEKSVEVVRTVFKPLAKEYDAKIRFFEEYDVTGKSFCEGTVEDFLEYFRDRFEKLSSILSKRPLHLRPLSRLDRTNPGHEVDIIGMVYDVRESRKGNIIVEIEDLEERVTVVIPKEGEIGRKAQYILPDDVLAFRGVMTSQGVFVARDIFWPEIDDHVPNYADVDLAVAITSDWHVGSRLCLKKQIEKFIEWLKGKEGNERLRELAGKTKYLIINGDVVDGVGVYPSQIDELEIKDIYGQYEAFSKYVEEIPEYIEIIIGPGNHDAVRRLEPQPALPDDFVNELKGYDNVHLVGSPSYFSLEGVEVLMYHGTTMDDVISRIPELDYTKPELALSEYLKRRHLVPSYGLKQPIVPEKKDYMLIERVPDILTCGHVHKNGYGSYKSVKTVVSGTFQDQTPFQLEHGHVPTPGVVPVVTLADHVIHQIKLNGVENV